MHVALRRIGECVALLIISFMFLYFLQPGIGYASQEGFEIVVPEVAAEHMCFRFEVLFETLLQFPDQLSAVCGASLPAPSVDHVLINEVYYDPDDAHGGGSYEWIELYNPTDAAVDLSGWSVSDAVSSDAFPEGTALPSGGYAVIAATSDLASLWDIPDTAIIVDLGSALGGGLNNGGDAVYLRDSSALEVDALSYGSNIDVFDPSIPDAPKGYSLARISVAVDSDSALDWENQEVPNPGI